MTEVDSTVATLYREGTTKKAIEHGNNLHLLRNKYSAWLTDEIGTRLSPFEDALKKIGAWQGYIESTSAQKSCEKRRTEMIDFVDQAFCKVLGINDDELGQLKNNTAEIDNYISEEIVKKRIRQILDIEDLVSLKKGVD